MQYYFRWFYESLRRLRAIWSQIWSDLIRIASYGASLLEKMFLRDIIIEKIWPNGFFCRPFSTLKSDWKFFCTRPWRHYTTVWIMNWGSVVSGGSRRYGRSYSGTQLGHSTRASSTTMETRCPKSSFQTFQKRNRLEIRSYRCYGEHGEKMFVFLGLFVHAAVRGGTCAFTLK